MDGLEDFEFRLVVPGAPFVQKNSRDIRVVPERRDGSGKPGSHRCPYCKLRFHVLLVPSTAYKKWRREAVKHLDDFWHRRIRGALPVWLDDKKKHQLEVNAAIVTYLERRGADADNLYPGPQDAMQEAGILTNDVVIRTHDGSDRRKDKDNPRVEITLTPARKN